MTTITGKGDAGVSALEPSTRFPRGVVLTLALLLFIGLFFSRPPLSQFLSEVIVPTSRAIIQERTGSGLLGFLGDVERRVIPGMGHLLDAAENSDRKAVQDDVLNHTQTHDWVVVSYFKIQYENCLSDYLGVAGRLLTLSDQCKVEPIRAKGGGL